MGKNKTFPASTFVYCGRYEMRHKSEPNMTKDEALAKKPEQYPHVIGDFSGASVDAVLAFATTSQGLTVAFRPAFRDKATSAEANAWRRLWTVERFAQYAECVPDGVRQEIENGAPYIVLSWANRGTLDVPPQVADMRERLRVFFTAANFPISVDDMSDEAVEVAYAAIPKG